MGRGVPLTEAATNPNDLTALSSSASAPVGGSRTGSNTKRKQTLISLLDALAELSKDEELDVSSTNQQPSFEDDRDVPTVDEHLQKVGADAFNKFQRRITNLDKELRNFANAARQLGSSVGILSSSYHLRERLAQILFLFRENAADLFPRKVLGQTQESLVNPNYHWRKGKKHRHTPPHVHNTIVMEKLDPEDFPEQLQMFARDVTTFLDCLNEFPEFTDEAVNTSILSLEGDLKYWASCLKAYEGQFRYPAVRRYLHDLSSEMGDHIDSITSSLSVSSRLVSLQFVLHRNTPRSHCDKLQFSFNTTGTPLADAVNAFWFTSLVFSIGAAVNSLLGLTWKQAMYRSPGHRVPCMLFHGLVVFAYSSGQHRITSTLTTAFSACSCFGLAAVSVWFASERWTFSRHNGQKWLADVLSETKVKVYSMPGIKWLVYEPRAWAWDVSHWGRRQWRRASNSLANMSSRT
ncbi:hypothetical protein A0H81_12274 [Grifola frondosa]|uniref:DUF6535 domain-containing protein n=1 Tax=Grifola frondosa TaxID=5627 RepID=A0A1C7LV84_GRIFR|nr:hypothetical protein A0H81_12274 [Grifola frondosa]